MFGGLLVPGGLLMLGEVLAPGPSWRPPGLLVPGALLGHLQEKAFAAIGVA